MFYLISVRDIGVTKMNVFTMVWLAFVSSMTIGWQGAYAVYLFETQLNVPDAQFQEVNGYSGTIQAIGGITMVLFIGVIYDTFGRKIPMIWSIFVCIIGQFMFPFIKNEFEYYVASMFLVPLPILLVNPWIPDLVQEQS